MKETNSRAVSLGAAFCAAFLVLLWFLPVVKVYGDAYTMLEAAKFASEPTGAFWVLIAIFALPVVWALIQKKWAAIVGIIGTLITAAWCIFQVSDWKSNGLDMTFWAKLLIPVAIISFLLSVIRLVVLFKKPKPAPHVCPQCGQQIAPGKTFCGKCGAKLEN